MANTKRTKAIVENNEGKLSLEPDYQATKEFFLNVVMTDGQYTCPLMLSQTKTENSNSGIFFIREKFQELAAISANIANQKGEDEVKVISLKTLLHQLEEEYPDDDDIDINFVISRKQRITPLVKSTTKRENPFLKEFTEEKLKEEEELQERKKRIQELQKQNFEAVNPENEEIPF